MFDRADVVEWARANLFLIRRLRRSNFFAILTRWRAIVKTMIVASFVVGESAMQTAVDLAWDLGACVEFLFDREA